MSIILNNLRQLRKKTPLLFTIIIVVQVLVSFSILYVIGSIANDYFSLKEDRASTLFLDIHFDAFIPTPPKVRSDFAGFA